MGRDNGSDVSFEVCRVFEIAEEWEYKVYPVCDTKQNSF